MTSSRHSRLPALRAVSALITLVMVAAGPVRAQEQPDTITVFPTYELEGIVIRGDRQIGTTGGVSGLVAFPDSLALRPASTVEDALRELPMVLVRQNSRGMAEISMRGSESRQVALLLDGVPLSLSWDHRADPSIIPLLGVQTLTLVRGLPSVVSGPNVLGGVIEMGMGRAVTGADLESGLRARAGWDDSGYHSLDVAGSGVTTNDGDRWVVRGGAGYRSRDGIPLPGDVADATSKDGLRTNSDVEEATAFGAVRWERAAGSWVSLSSFGLHAERGVPPELHVSEPRLWRIPGEWQVVTALTAGTGPQPTRMGVGSLETNVGYSMGRQDIDAFASLDYDDVVETESGRDGTLSLRVLGDHSVGRGGVVRGAATYADVRHLEVLDGNERNHYRQRLWSVASELTWRLGRSHHLTVGTSFDGADTPESGGLPTLKALNAWAGRLTATTFALRPDLQLHFSVSSRARFPALRELYSDALGRFEPNPDLRPERLTAAEAGATWKSGGVELQATGFRHHLVDAVVRTATQEGRFRRVNRDAIDSSGIELLLGTDLRGATLVGDLLLQEVRITDLLAGSSPVRPEHMPEFSAGLSLDAPLPFAVRGLVSLDHTGRQYCVHPDLDTEIALDWSTRLDLGLQRTWRGARPGRGFRASVAIDNAADAAAFDQCGMPQSGRTLRIGLELF